MYTSCKMASRIYLLCLLVSLLSVCHSLSSSWSSQSASSSSDSYPSSSTSLSGGSPYGYPSSSSGLSGSSGSSSWSSGSSSYPSSSSGLSGSGSSSYNKPSSSYGSSGWNYGPSSYPSSSSGLSGSGYRSINDELSSLKSLGIDVSKMPSFGSSSNDKSSSLPGLAGWNFGSSRYPSSSSGLSGSYNNDLPSSGIKLPDISSYGLSNSGHNSPLYPYGYPGTQSGQYGSGSNSYKNPSSSSSLNFGSSSYPSSSSGLSGGSSGLYNYPSSSTGLSGSSKYPSSSSGLSGSSSGFSNYPSSSSGLSGSSSGSSKYPSSSSGISDSSYGSSKYPSTSSSSSGFYGPGSGYKPASNSGGLLYPTSSTGLSGVETRLHQKHTHNVNSEHTSTHRHTKHFYPSKSVPLSMPTYYNTPQYVYINEYRHSNSRYGDLLTGLSLYNLGRSRSQFHNQYYYDDYYRNKYNNPSSSSSLTYKEEDKPQEQATCILKLKENGREDVLKIPCEIVSTFTEGSKNVTPSQQTLVNGAVCTTTTTVIDNTVPTVSVMPPLSVLPVAPYNSPLFDTNASMTGINRILSKTVTTINATMANVTVCTTNSSLVDPLTVKGPPVNAKDMECVVEIQTKDAFLSNAIDCNTLVEYAKMPEPKKDTGILPERSTLKKLLNKPPWWMSLFIAL